MSTPLYRWYLEGQPDDAAFIESTWGQTPWMVRTHANLSGRNSLDFLNAQRRWCSENIGTECSHGQAGTWRYGATVVNGMRRFGFATEDQMNRFLERWGGHTTP